MNETITEKCVLYGSKEVKFYKISNKERLFCENCVNEIEI